MLCELLLLAHYLQQSTLFEKVEALSLHCGFMTLTLLNKKISRLSYIFLCLTKEEPSQGGSILINFSDVGDRWDNRCKDVAWKNIPTRLLTKKREYEIARTRLIAWY